MADIFYKSDANKLVKNKNFVFFGDSNMRSMYKDFLQLNLNNGFTTRDALRLKLEDTYCGDNLVSKGDKNNCRTVREERVFRNGDFTARFYFITKCLSDYVTSCFDKLVKEDPPDVVIYNSCLWDITRWGPKGVENYRRNLPNLMKYLKKVLPPKCLFIWCTTLPISQQVKGGFLIKPVNFLSHILRFHIMEANLFASNMVDKYDFDVLDLHRYLFYEINRRAEDGVHWSYQSIRHMTNLLLTHISLSWNVCLPGNYHSQLLQSLINKDSELLTGSPLKNLNKQQAAMTPPPIQFEFNYDSSRMPHSDMDYRMPIFTANLASQSDRRTEENWRPPPLLGDYPHQPPPFTQVAHNPFNARGRLNARGRSRKRPRRPRRCRQSSFRPRRDWM